MAFENKMLIAIVFLPVKDRDVVMKVYGDGDLSYADWMFAMKLAMFKK